MPALTRDDLTVIEGEARISDRRLSEALGYNRVNDLHRLIRQNEGELAEYGEVFCTSAKNPREGIFCTSAKNSPDEAFRQSGTKPRRGRGRPVEGYLLTRDQAVLLCVLARTERARAARRQVIRVFLDWQDGIVTPKPKRAEDPFALNAARLEVVARTVESLRAVGDPALNATHLPIWKNGRRPRYWGDLEVRSFLINSHRQMSIPECAALGAERFGPRCPKKSAIGFLWKRLDAVLGPLSGARLALPAPTEAA